MKIPEDYTKVAMFDLEGTLTVNGKQGSWQALHRAFGVPPEEDRELYRRYHDGEIDFETWNRKVMELWHKHSEQGPTKEFLERFFDGRLEVREGSKELVEDMHDNGFFTVLVSGALDMYSQRGAEAFDMHRHADTIDLVFEDGVAVDLWFAEYDRQGKEALLERIRQENDHIREIWAFGNGRNDIGMVEAADRSFMVPSADKVEYENLEKPFVGDLSDFMEVIRRDRV